MFRRFSQNHEEIEKLKNKEAALNFYIGRTPIMFCSRIDISPNVRQSVAVDAILDNLATLETSHNPCQSGNSWNALESW